MLKSVAVDIVAVVLGLPAKKDGNDHNLVRAKGYIHTTPFAARSGHRRQVWQVPLA